MPGIDGSGGFLCLTDISLTMCFVGDNRLACCVMASNIAEALVSKGLARVVRYRQDDDNRSTHYDQLLAAEARAEKKGVGLFSKEDAPIHRVSDLSGVSFSTLSWLNSLLASICFMCYTFVTGNG